MRMISAAAAALLLLLPLGARAEDEASPGAKQDAQACQPWDRGAAAREHGWTLKQLDGAERGALIAYYDKRVAPRADPKSDKVLVASHPDWPLIRVLIVRDDCIVDIGQMGPELLARILSNTGTPT